MKRTGAFMLIGLIKWPILGALFAGGAIGLGRWLAPDLLAPTARDLGQQAGQAAGEGFAQGVYRFNQAIAEQAKPFIGRWSSFADGGNS